MNGLLTNMRLSLHEVAVIIRNSQNIFGSDYYAQQLATSIIKNIERRVKNFREQNKIEFLDPPKTGGYYTKKFMT